MKTLYKFLLFFLLLPVTIFPQNRISETNRNFKEIKSTFIKFESDIRKDTFREKQFYKNNIDEKTVINRKLLRNGFLLIEKLWQFRDGSAWVNGGQTSYTYDENNNLTEMLYKHWDSVWMIGWKYSLVYDVNNNQTEGLYQTWEYKNNAWVNNDKYSSTYDENNNETEYLEQHWDGSAWVNYYKISYAYDENNNRTVELYQDWDGFAWMNSLKYSYTYDENNNLTEEVHQKWKDSAWVNMYKYSYTYDKNNNEIEHLEHYWDGSAWGNDWKYSYTYDENNNETEDLWQSWDGSAWINVYKILYKYGSVTKINEDLSFINSYNLSNNYPNPFNPSTTIRYSIPKQSHITLKIYDIIGREVAILVNEEKPAGNYQIGFNAANLPSGVYFYQLKAGSYVETNKMVLLK